MLGTLPRGASVAGRETGGSTGSVHLVTWSVADGSRMCARRVSRAVYNCRTQSVCTLFALHTRRLFA